MKLVERLSEPGYTVTLLSSFSCDFAWIERIAQRLRAAGHEHILVLIDAARLTLAVPHLGALAPGLGRDYTVLPVSMPGAFHAKIIAQLGPNGAARLFVNSANLTLGSHLANLEVLNLLDAAQDPRVAPLIGDAVHALVGHCDRRIARVDAILSAASALAPEPGGGRPVLLEDGSLIAFLSVPGALSLFDQLRRRVGNEPLRRVTVLSAFWDRHYGMLKVLRRYWKPERLVMLVPEGAHLAPERLERVETLELRRLTAAPFGGRYAHAKLIVAEGEHYDHVLAGSANCSFTSMGRVGKKIRNAEAAVYQRHPSGVVLPALGLDPDGLPLLTLELDTLSPLLGSRPPWLDSEPLAGVFEGRDDGDVLWWHPQQGLSHHGAGPLELAELDAGGEVVGWLAERERGEGVVVFAGPVRGRVVQPCAQGEPICGRGVVISPRR